MFAEVLLCGKIFIFSTQIPESTKIKSVIVVTSSRNTFTADSNSSKEKHMTASNSI